MNWRREIEKYNGEERDRRMKWRRENEKGRRVIGREGYL